jgi:hypothetical protein
VTLGSQVVNLDAIEIFGRLENFYETWLISDISRVLNKVCICQRLWGQVAVANLKSGSPHNSKNSVTFVEKKLDKIRPILSSHTSDNGNNTHW